MPRFAGAQITAGSHRCQHCGAPFTPRPDQLRHSGWGRFCSNACANAYRREHFAERFWRSVDTSGTCWLWTGTRSRNGYGTIQIGGNGGRRRLVHRVAWELCVGPIPDGSQVLHECDVRHCVNSAHLFLGSQADNLRDMAAKGRQHFQKHPEHTPTAKLTQDTVRAIRRRYAAGGVLQKALAQEFGVDARSISAVVNRITWKHLPD